MEHRSNPVLDADWPDPDVIRVGEDFWMIASSFHRAPGLPVLRSCDLVTWEHVTNALPALVPTEHYSLPRRGSGVWAPCLREHAGVFHIVYPDPEHGIFVLDAAHPAGPWSAPRLLLAGRGLIDPCPLWDEDGRAYLVHGWARSRARIKNRLSLLEVMPDLSAALSPSQVIIDGADLPGMATLEGPKIHRHGGWYWIFAPAGGVADGYQVVFRSRHLHGPYEHRVVLEQDTSPVNGPHQGALVDDVHGDWWFVHFQDRGVFGRVTHVQPVRFDGDGWPHMGEAIDDVRGRPVAMVPAMGARAEAAGAGSPPSALPYTEPTRSDDFTAPELHPRWHWQANPQPSWSRCGEGRLDLAFAPSPRGDLRDLGPVLAQQLPGQPSSWTTTMRLPATGGDDRIGVEHAGLVVLGLSYAWAGLRRDAQGLTLASGTMAEGEAEEVTCTHRLLTPDPTAEVSVRLRLDIDAGGMMSLRADQLSGTTAMPGERAPSAALPPNADEASDTPLLLLEDWQATKGHWVGAEVGLFATAESMVHHELTERSASFGPLTVQRKGREI